MAILSENEQKLRTDTMPQYIIYALKDSRTAVIAHVLLLAGILLKMGPYPAQTRI